jgi:hypothetical protein
MKRIILSALLVSLGSGGALAHDTHRHHNDSLQLAVTLATGLHYGGHYHSGRYCNVNHYNRYRPAKRYYPYAHNPHRYSSHRYNSHRYNSHRYNPHRYDSHRYSPHHYKNKKRHYSGHDRRTLRGATLSPKLGGKTFGNKQHSDRQYRSDRHRDHRAYPGADRRNHGDRAQRSPRNRY